MLYIIYIVPSKFIYYGSVIMIVEDEIMLGINFRGEIDNYNDMGELYDDLRRAINDWILWNVDGDYDSWIDQYD